MLRAGEILAECHTFATDDIHLSHAAGEGKRRFQRVSQTTADALAHGKTVNDDLHGVLDVLFQRDLLVEVVHVTVDFYAGVTGAAGGVQLFLLGAFALTDDRREDLELRPLFQLEHSVHHLIHALLADDPPTHRAVRHAHAGVQKAQIIVNFRHGTHGGAGVVAGGLLVDGNGRRQAGDLVHIGLVHPAKEHPGVAGQALDIAALAVGVDGVEGKARLARAGKAGHNDEFFTREGQIHVFQVVLPRTLDDYFIVCQGTFSLFSVSVHGSASAPSLPRNPQWGSRPGADGRSGRAGRPHAQIPAA